MVYGAIDDRGEVRAGSPVLRQAGLADAVYEAILARLMALKIAPGGRISVDALARELGVSHTPVREALGRLEGEDLVVKTHLIGFSAAPQITRRRLEDLYELRLLLEPDAARKAVHTLALAPERLQDLRLIAQGMARRAGGDERMDYSAFARQDAIFHDCILDLAGNQLIRQTLAQQHAHFHIFRLMFHARVTEEAIDEHQALLDAFEAGDAAAAHTAMRAHIERSRDRMRLAFD